MGNIVSWVLRTTPNTESSNSGSTENNTPSVSGNDQVEARQPPIINPAAVGVPESGPEVNGEDTENSPASSSRIRSRGRRHERERVQRHRTVQNRSRSRSPLRSAERPEREGQRTEQANTRIQARMGPREPNDFRNNILGLNTRPELAGQEIDDEQPGTSQQLQRELRERNQSRNSIPISTIRPGTYGHEMDEPSASEQAQRASTARTRSRSRSPLRSSEREWVEEMNERNGRYVRPNNNQSRNSIPISTIRPEIEAHEMEGPGTSEQAQRARTERNRFRSRSPLRSSEEEAEEMSERNGGYFTPNDRQLREPRRVQTQIVQEGDPRGDCSICLMEYESGQRITTLQCSHCFHHECLTRWLQENPTCPLCRYRLSNNPGRRLRLFHIEYVTERDPDGSERIVQRARFLD